MHRLVNEPYFLFTQLSLSTICNAPYTYVLSSATGVEMDVQLSVFFKFISIDESFIFAVYFQTFQNLDDYVINYYKSSFYGYFQTF
jgi:hypothetical protein